MATVEALTTGLEAPGPVSLFSPLTDNPATGIDTTPTTPTRPNAPNASTPPTQRRSDRTKNPSERMREIDKGIDDDTGVDDQNTDHGRKTKGKRGRPPKERQVEVQAETATLPMAQVLQIMHSMAASYEAKMEQHMKAYENKIDEHMKAYEKIEEHMKAYEDKIKALLDMGQKNADRVVALETQYLRMMELIKNSANEQAKMTQTWAQVVAGAPASGNTSPTTPSSQP